MYLVIDIGGTKTLIALFSARGRVIQRYKFPTPSKKSEFLDTLFNALVPFALKHGSKIEAIAIAVPGHIENNIAVWFGNRPWKNLDLAATVNKLFTQPAYLLNDANLATIYESSFHLGLTLYLTFSTGIGGGLAHRGKLAKNSASVEPGHEFFIWDGKSLEWEDIASCAAIGAHYGVQATSVRGTAAYEDIAHRVSLGLAGAIQKYHPDVVVIGGPLGKLYPQFAKPLRKRLKELLPSGRKLPRLVAARRPQESTIYGGYAYAKSKATTRK